MGAKKIKVLLVTANPPMDEMGGCILLYRQFVSQKEIDLFVMTNRSDYDFSLFPGCLVKLPWIIRRLSKTRLSLLIHDLVHVSMGWFLPYALLRAARRYDPDLVLIGAETPIADLGITLARRLRVPLAGYFMDCSTFALLGNNWVKKRESRRFLKRYQQCDLAFGICPEMIETLGPHQNAQIYYPAKTKPENIPPPKQRRSGEPYQLLFAGNLGQWYGEMLARLADEAPNHKNIRLIIAGKNAKWSQSQEESLRYSGIYLGFKKGEEYDQLFRDADCLLICMGFEQEARLIESTSFKSKIVDYMVSGRPIVVWGPEYCTAVRHAKKYGFAESVTIDDPQAVFVAVKNLMDNPQRCAILLQNARQFFDRYLDADIVYKEANKKIIELASK